MSEPAVVREYAELASGYDARWSSYIYASVQETLARLPRKTGDRILDIGCGTGALLAALAAESDDLQLQGIDPVPEMLAVARRRLPEEVILGAGWADNLQLPDACVDTVVSSSVFHYIRDPVRALAEMHRVLVPGGNLVITDWCRDFATTRMTDWYLSMFNTAHFRTYGLAELEALVKDAAFTSVDGQRYKAGWWGLMTMTAAKIS
jgi:ubiquinone/menaquinone biosynthesis C-methylase UbiE